MAKGDKKSRKGKIAMGTYGTTRRRRPLKKTADKKAVKKAK